MGYSEARKDEAVRLLQKHLPGIDPRFARAWVNAEQGQCNNILGVTSASGNCGAYSGGSQGCGSVRRLCSFNSMDDGARAAATLINGSGYYSKLSRAIREGRPGVQQAQALIDSPWAGNRWWYFDIMKRVFGKENLKEPYGGVRKKNNNGSSKPKANTASSGNACASIPTVLENTLTIPALSRNCFKQITGIQDDNHVINQSDIDTITKYLTQNAPIGSVGYKIDDLTQYVNQLFWQKYTKKDALGQVTTTTIADLPEGGAVDVGTGILNGFGVDLTGIERGVFLSVSFWLV